MTEAEFQDWLEGKQIYWERQASERHEFSDAGLARQFVPYFRSGQRVKVRLHTGEEKTGFVGVTTGWAPAFMLLLRAHSEGSIWTLSDEDRVVGVRKPNGQYRPVEEVST